MRRHLSEFSKSSLGARSPTVPRLAPRGPAPSVRGGVPTFVLPPQRLALASPEQFIAVQYVRSANFALRG